MCNGRYTNGKTVKQVEVFVPAAFTPNSDGLNDLLARY
jgi:hypothetical protein